MFFFSQLFFSFSLSHFYSIFSLHFFLFSPQIFVITFFISTIFFKSLPFFCYGTFLFMYPSHFLPSSALFSIFFLFFFQPYPLAVRERVCNVHISPMSLQLYYARQTLIFFFWFFRKKIYFENSSIFIFCRIINFFIPPLQKNSYNLLLYAASILTRHWLGFVRERGWNRPPSNFNFFLYF
jgi:hypothetical protein